MINISLLPIFFLFLISFSSWGTGESWSAQSDQQFAQSQEKTAIQYPTFEIKNYPSEVHGGIGGTWGITQARDGKMYFSNSFSVLIFDGSNWQTVKTKGNKAARSVAIDKNDNVIVGTKGDMGVISSDPLNKINYRSIIHETDSKKLEPDTVYEVLPLDTKTYLYRTAREIYIHKKGVMQKIENPKNFRFGPSHLIDGKIYIYVRKQGLFQLNDGKLSIVTGTEVFKTTDQGINGVFKEKGGLVIVTRRAGIFQLKSGVLKQLDYNNKLIKSTNIYRTISLRNGGYALATYDGVFILDHKLEIENHISRDTGLITDNVRSLYEDIEGNLWAGTNDGISKIKLNSGMRFFDKDLSKINAGVSRINVFNNKIYLATQTGISVSEIHNNSLRQFFKPILKDSVKSQAWGLLNHKNNLFIVSNNGIGFIDKKENYDIFLDRELTGSVYAIKNSEIFKNKILLGTYLGLGLIDPNKKGEIEYLKLEEGKTPNKIWNFYELPKSQEIWTRIKGKGVYRLKFNTPDKLNPKKFTVTKFDTSDGLPIGSLYTITPFEFNDEILFGTENGIYRFDKSLDKFVLDERFSKLPGYKNKKVKYSAKGPKKDYWVVFLDRSEGFRNIEFYRISENFNLSKIELGKLSNFSDIKFNFYKNNVLLSGSLGVAIFPENLNPVSSSGRVLINQITEKSRSIYDHAPRINFEGEKLKIPSKFPFIKNNIKFSFSATDYVNEKNNRFRYKLSNFDEVPTYSRNSEVTYRNLPPGNYSFAVEGINAYGQKLLPDNYNFEIEPPWWQTTYFYVAEIAFFLILLFFTILIKQNENVQKLATALTFVVIIIIFEYVSMLADPLILEISGGVPVFALISKILLGVMLQPTEKIASKAMDWCSQKLSRNTS